MDLPLQSFTRYDLACLLLVIALLVIVAMLAAGAFLLLGGANL